MKLELYEVNNGFRIVREGFNGSGQLDIWCGTMDQVLQVIKMIIDEEGGFNR